MHISWHMHTALLAKLVEKYNTVKGNSISNVKLWNVTKHLITGSLCYTHWYTNWHTLIHTCLTYLMSLSRFLNTCWAFMYWKSPPNVIIMLLVLKCWPCNCEYSTCKYKHSSMPRLQRGLKWCHKIIYGMHVRIVLIVDYRLSCPSETDWHDQKCKKKIKPTSPTQQQCTDIIVPNKSTDSAQCTQDVFLKILHYWKDKNL